MVVFVEFYIDQGTTWDATIDLYDEANNVPMNLTGVTVTSQMRKSFYSANATANFVCTVANAMYGVARMSLDSNVSSNVRGGRYVFDVFTRTSSGIVARPIEGIITIGPRASR